MNVKFVVIRKGYCLLALNAYSGYETFATVLVLPIFIIVCGVCSSISILKEPLLVCLVIL